MLAEKSRDNLLFVMGVNNGLRVIDLLNLKVKDVHSSKQGDVLNVKETKTGKNNILVINKAVFKSMKRYLEVLHPEDDAFLFQSRKGDSPLQSQAFCRNWFRASYSHNGNFEFSTSRAVNGHWHALDGIYKVVEFGVGGASANIAVSPSGETTTTGNIGMDNLGLTSGHAGIGYGGHKKMGILK